MDDKIKLTEDEALITVLLDGDDFVAKYCPSCETCSDNRHCTSRMMNFTCCTLCKYEGRDYCKYCEL